MTLKKTENNQIELDDVNGVVVDESTAKDTYWISFFDEWEKRVLDFIKFYNVIPTRYLGLQWILNKNDIICKNINKVKEWKVLSIDGKHLNKKVDSVKIHSVNEKLVNCGFLIRGLTLSEGIYIDDITTGKSEESTYKVGDSKLGKMEFDNFSNLSENFILQNLEIDKLIIKNSDLWKMKFNWVTIHKLYLENVTLNDCIFNSVEFPKDYELWRNEDFDKRKVKSNLPHKQMKDNYRQLKHVMDKNWNKTEANRFFAKEMDSCMEEAVRKEVFSEWWFKKMRTEGFSGIHTKIIWERVSLWTWKFISDFWNNWIRPMFLIIIWAFLFTDLKFLWDNYTDLDKGIQNLNLIKSEIVSITDAFIKSLWVITAWLVLSFFIKRYFILFTITFGLVLELIVGADVIKNFLNLLYPLYGFKMDFIAQLDLVETTWLIIYKAGYWILLYHLIVALKRTTKR